MKRRLKRSEVNHLRRLLGWVACDIGPSPDEIVDTVRKIAPAISNPSEDGKQRLVEWHEESARIPKYVRDAIKALRKAIESDGQIVDVEPTLTRRLSHRLDDSGIKQMVKVD
jgi:NAD-specific glutamate dehydrogenase